MCVFFKRFCDNLPTKVNVDYAIRSLGKADSNFYWRITLRYFLRKECQISQGNLFGLLLFLPRALKLSLWNSEWVNGPQTGYVLKIYTECNLPKCPSCGRGCGLYEHFRKKGLFWSKIGNISEKKTVRILTEKRILILCLL